MTGLRLESVSAGYLGVNAVRDVSLSCDAGEVVAIVGPNGAGKTTTLLAAAGVIRPSVGEVSLNGAALSGRSPDSIARAGLVLIPSDRGTFPGLTVADHLRLAEKSPAGRVKSTNKITRASVLEQFPQLTPLQSRKAALLSGGEQQMLAIAKSLLLTPRVVMVDELSLGLAPRLVSALLPALGRMAREFQMGVLVVEQHYELALAVADRAVVMNHGRIVLEASADELRENPAVIEAAYFGRSDK